MAGYTPFNGYMQEGLQSADMARMRLNIANGFGDAPFGGTTQIGMLAEQNAGFDMPANWYTDYKQGVGSDYFGGGNYASATPTEGAGWFSENMGNISKGMNVVTGLGNLYFANEANSLAKKQFKNRSAWANRNLQNQAVVYQGKLGDHASSLADSRGLTGQAKSDWINNYKSSRKLNTSRI